MGMISGMFDRSPMPSKAEEELRERTRAYGVQGEEDLPAPRPCPCAHGVESVQSRGLSRTEGLEGSERILAGILLGGIGYQGPQIRERDPMSNALNFPPVFRATSIILIAATLVVGCGESATEPEPDPTVDGSWSGPVGSDITLNLVLSEADDGSVSGSGAFAGSSESVSITVSSGTHSYPNLSLVLGQEGYEDVNLSGTVTPSYIEATLNGSGFVNDEVILAKR